MAVRTPDLAATSLTGEVGIADLATRTLVGRPLLGHDFSLGAVFTQNGMLVTTGAGEHAAGGGVLRRHHGP